MAVRKQKRTHKAALVTQRPLMMRNNGLSVPESDEVSRIMPKQPPSAVPLVPVANQHQQARIVHKGCMHHTCKQTPVWPVHQHRTMDRPWTAGRLRNDGA